MSAVRRMPCALVVEQLEHRFLLDGTNSIVSGLTVYGPDSRSLGDQVWVGAPTDAYPDGDDVPNTAVMRPAGISQTTPPAVIDTDETKRYRAEREPESDGRAERQLIQLAPHEGNTHVSLTGLSVPHTVPLANDEPGNAPPVQPPIPMRLFNSEQSLGSPNVVPLSRPVPGWVGEPAIARFNGSKSESVEVPATPGITESTPSPAASADVPARSEWKDTLLDPLAGVPFGEAVAVNLSELGTEAGRLLADIIDLGADQGEAELSEYIWLAGGFIFLCGGVQLVRAIRSSRGTSAPRTLEPLEGTQ